MVAKLKIKKAGGLVGCLNFEYAKLCIDMYDRVIAAMGRKSMICMVQYVLLEMQKSLDK